MERRLFPVILALFQAVTSIPPEKIDLTFPQPCRTQESTDSEVIVCGRRNDGSSPYRINQSSVRSTDIPKAEAQIADGVRMSAETENVDVGGTPSNRLMVRLKIKF